MMTELQKKLHTALRYALYTVVIGADNKIEDIEKSQAWVDFFPYRYNVKGEYRKLLQSKPIQSESDRYVNKQSCLPGTFFHKKIKQWYYHINKETDLSKAYYNETTLEVYLLKPPLNPLYTDPKCAVLNDMHRNFLFRVLWIIQKRQGNCGDRAHLIAHYLWEHSEGIDKIEIIRSKTFDHAFVVINRKGDLKDPTTWEDAMIVDGWYGKDGIIYSASEFNIKIREIIQFSMKQVAAINKIKRCFNTFSSPNDVDTDIDLESVLEIIPDKHIYPESFESYYEIMNTYPSNLWKTEEQRSTLEPKLPIIKKSFVEHRIKLKDFLNLLPNRLSFLSPKNNKLNEIKLEKVPEILNEVHSGAIL